MERQRERLQGMRQERMVLAGGLGLRVARWGEGPGHPVVLLHGFTGSVEAWGGLPRALAEGLAPGRPVVAVDLPGHGASDTPSDPRRHRMESVAGALVEVLDRLGSERAAWVGYSMGGRVALGTAVLHPARTEAVVLESASPGLASAGERRERRRRDEALAEGILEEGVEAFVDAWMEQPLFATQRRLPGEVRVRERTRRLGCDPRGLAATLRELGTGAQPSFWEGLAGLRAPALLMAGGEDGKFAALAEAMASALPLARVRIVPGAGHTVHLEDRAAWLEAVVPFLNGLEGPA